MRELFEKIVGRQARRLSTAVGAPAGADWQLVLPEDVADERAAVVDDVDALLSELDETVIERQAARLLDDVQASPRIIVAAAIPTVA
jgi:hypothetical protein